MPKNITLKYTLMGVCGPYGPLLCRCARYHNARIRALHKKHLAMGRSRRAYACVIWYRERLTLSHISNACTDLACLVHICTFIKKLTKLFSSFSCDIEFKLWMLLDGESIHHWVRACNSWTARTDCIEHWRLKAILQLTSTLYMPIYSQLMMNQMNATISIFHNIP